MKSRISFVVVHVAVHQTKALFVIDDIKKDLIYTAAKNQNVMHILISFFCRHNFPLNNDQKLSNMIDDINDMTGLTKVLFTIDDIKDLIVTAAKNKIAVSWSSFSPTKGGPLSAASLLNKQKDRYNIIVK